MNANRFLRRASNAGLMAVALSLAACTLPGGNKAGGSSEPIVLRMAIESSKLDFTPQIRALIERVKELSDGGLRIDETYGVGNWQPHAEQQIVQQLAGGGFDLAFVGTRVFDTLGVKSFQALTAPMLVDSYPLERAVVDSAIPEQMMKSLDTLNVTGLGVVAGGMRKPIAVHKPLLNLKDWQGITFAAFDSEGQAEAIRALGAESSNLVGPSLIEALTNGTVHGFEEDLLTYQVDELQLLAPYVAANVSLWPQTLAIIANPGRIDRLTRQQLGWLQQAVKDTIARSTTDLVADDSHILANLCASGARFANVSDADISAMQRAFAPVYAQLEQDQPTQAFVSEIKQIKGGMTTGDPLVIPPNCTGPAPAPSAITPRTKAITPLDGSWEVTLTRAELMAGPGVSHDEDNPANYGHIVLEFNRGEFRMVGGDGETNIGTYVVTGDLINFYWTGIVNNQTPGEIAGEIWTLKWSIDRDSLTFVEQTRTRPTTLLVKPWTRVGG